MRIIRRCPRGALLLLVASIVLASPGLRAAEPPTGAGETPAARAERLLEEGRRLGAIERERQLRSGDLDGDAVTDRLILGNTVTWRQGRRAP
jgi:hypothetical protein